MPTTASTTLPAGEKIYVANHGKAGGTSYNPTVTVFSATASGNVAPLAILSGANTNEAQVQFPAVDTAGDLFISDQGASGGSTAGFVSEFLPTKLSGNQFPTSTISGLDNPEGIAFDSSGDMYVATELAINVYPPGSTSPMRTITGPYESPYGIFVDAKNNLYVALSNEVAVYAPGASGAATPTQEFDTPATSSAPTSTRARSWSTPRARAARPRFRSSRGPIPRSRRSTSPSASSSIAITSCT
jgi:hypothetical protein